MAAIVVCGCGYGPVPPLVETMVTGLNNPTGVAVLSDGTLIVVESGAGQIITVAADGRTSPLVTGFALGTYFPYDIGPLSVIVQADGSLIVGEGGNSISGERVSFYDSEGVELAGTALVPVSGGNFHGMAIHPLTGDLYVASAGTNRVFRAPAAEGGGFDALSEFVADTTQPPIGYAAPTALAIDDAGVLLLGLADSSGGGIVRLSTDDPAQSVFIDQVYSTERMVTGIALRPSDGAVFFAEFHPTRLGQARIARFGGNDEVQTFTEDVVAPSALAFAPDDSLYVATLGETPNGEAGGILKLTIQTFAEPDGTDEASAAPAETHIDPPAEGSATDQQT